MQVGAFRGTFMSEPEFASVRNLIKKEIRPLVAYPVVYIILYIPAIINR